MEDDDFFEFKGVPCFEPFKSFHSSFDGRVRTCCFTGSKDWLGHLRDETGADIWHGAAFEKIREEAVQGRYLKSMCGTCLKKGAYPKTHDLRTKYNAYARWYKNVFKLDFLPGLRKTVESVPENGAICLRQRTEP